MTADEYLTTHKHTVTAEVLYACRYLEMRHLRFLIDFGFGNAVEKAAAEHTLELEEYDGKTD